MKKLVTILFLMLSFVFASYAQESEEIGPSRNTEIMRKVDIMDIEGKIVQNVSVTMKSMPLDLLLDYSRVKVKIIDTDGNTIWKKTLKKAYLYIFSNGQIQIGKPRFPKIVIWPQNGGYCGAIREKEGVY